MKRLGDVTGALSRLLMDGAEREPELLEHVFACLARVLKWLQRQLAADLPLALRHTRSLRRHRSRHVRLFAAQAAAFLLRAAPDAAVEDGVRAILAEATSDDTTVTVEAGASADGDGEEDGDGEGKDGEGKTSERRRRRPRRFEERTRAATKKEMLNNSDAAGALLAEAMKGAAHGRALARAASARPNPPSTQTSADGGRGDETDGTKPSATSSSDERLARAYTVAEGAVDSLAKHTRRGKCGVMWEHVLRAARRACADAGGEKRGGEEEEEEEEEEEDDESDSDRGKRRGGGRRRLRDGTRGEEPRRRRGRRGGVQRRARRRLRAGV